MEIYFSSTFHCKAELQALTRKINYLNATKNKIYQGMTLNTGIETPKK